MLIWETSVYIAGSLAGECEVPKLNIARGRQLTESVIMSNPNNKLRLIVWKTLHKARPRSPFELYFCSEKRVVDYDEHRHLGRHPARM